MKRTDGYNGPGFGFAGVMALCALLVVVLDIEK